ncbi:MAG TPA: CoB--CoM heterodisulfide reductase iron-sulfur subunit B family protein [Armatimonadota bacterium]|jgi:heterodisulfide reductase subunit B
MTIGYYPGCSLEGTAREYDESVRLTAGALDIELKEVDDWSCCGATSAHSVNHLLSLALPARNLALAESAGHDAVLAPCAACYNRLARASHEVATDSELAAKMPKIIGRPFANSVKVRTVVDVLREAIPSIKAKATKPLDGMKVACYYGCLLMRPPEVSGSDDPENPTCMEDVAKAAGAQPVSWNLRLECCGGSMSVPRTGSVVRLGRAILADARAAGAEALVVACPMCHSNLDFRQSAMANRGEAPMPVFYISQLVGLALGLPAKELGLDRHFVSVRSLLDNRPAAAAKEVA